MNGIDLKFSKNIHLIAIGGAIMHNLAIALKKMGHHVTGSDDAIFEPSRSRLKANGLLPEPGWKAEKITGDLDIIILGMHARKDNPELKKAIELGIPVYSFPEFIGLVSKNKKRVAIAGSHGKTTTTSMIMHILSRSGIRHDYLVGAQLKGYETMVSISDAPVMVIESDEYLSSCLDSRPKMMHYDPDIAVITGIEWDHMNVFPTKSDYFRAFRDFIRILRPECSLYYDERDEGLENLVKAERPASSHPYQPFKGEYTDGGIVINYKGDQYPVNIFGQHNFANLMAATMVTAELGVELPVALRAMGDFEGADKRMNIVFEDNDLVIIRDFAHAPSKVRSTVEAVAQRYKNRNVYAALELHTFSSLNPAFLPEYKGSLNNADHCCILYLPESSDHKKLKRLTRDDIRNGFGRSDLIIAESIDQLLEDIKGKRTEKKAILLMSSGYWGGKDIDEIVREIVGD